MQGPISGADSGADYLQPTFQSRVIASMRRKLQELLDRSVPYAVSRWLVLMLLIALYGIRVYIVQGFHIVTYTLGIHFLNLVIGFLTPLDEDNEGGPLLPTNDTDEFKPFIRQLPEFKFWYSCTKAILVCLFLTLFSILDLPVFWPILLVYFIVLVVVSMKRRIKHMIAHRYLPFNIGKKKYTKGVKRTPTEDIRSK